LAALTTVIATAAFLGIGRAELVLLQVALTTGFVVLIQGRAKNKLWLIPASDVGQLAGVGIVALLNIDAPLDLTSPLTIVANSFGLVLLHVVVEDARLRAEAEHNRHEAGEARRIAAEARLAMLRSRVQPHFLFNALNSIAALCSISPERASRATVQLGSLMRRALEIDFGRVISLREEMITVNGYLQIEKERFGSKLKVKTFTEGCEDVGVPAFSVQILVENAVLHGISKRSRSGEILIVARPNPRGWTIAVVDDGAGVQPKGDTAQSSRGLGILSQQLRSMLGQSARLHVAPRATHGTIAAFQIPKPIEGTPRIPR
jgi:LytS/YehU family sensor histidine kinase